MRRGISVASLALFCSLAASHAFAEPATHHVVLVTLDGVRIQELFSGMDPVIANAPEADSGIYDAEVTRQRYWRDTATERREALMPFFWKALAPAGMVLGNPAVGSGVKVRNDQWFSYPGYAEILTGEPHAEIKSNDFVRYPHETVLDYVHRRLALKSTEIAQIGSWDGFKYAASRKDGTFFMSGAYDFLPAEQSTPELDLLAGLRREVMENWEESSNDAVTFRLALGYLKKYQPRVLWLGLGQSDDWAHARRYDRVLDYLHLADSWIEELWQTLQSDERFRGRTTLVITTDHGRGRTPQDWAEHAAGIDGSQDIWLAIIGPDTPARGEVRDQPGITQSNIAATMLQYFGFDHRQFNPDAGPPVPDSVIIRGP
jgi:Type I phosphodiesterase / nucleotide pyrophosphatase